MIAVGLNKEMREKAVVMPLASDAGCAGMISDLEVLFRKYQADGRITIHYITKTYAGTL